MPKKSSSNKKSKKSQRASLNEAAEMEGRLAKAIRRATAAGSPERTLMGDRQLRPHLSQMGSSHVSFEGREMIQLIKTSTGYGGVSLGMNPVNNVAFPRLSGVASVYQRYRFKRLVAHYVPACPATQTGQVALTFLEDVTGDLPDSLGQVLNVSGAAGGSVIQARTARMVRPDPTWRYCGITDTGVGNLHYTGSLLVATEGGLNDTDAAGYLWLEYKVEFDDARPVRDLAVQRSVAAAGGGVSTQVVTDSGLLWSMPYTWSDVGAIGVSLLEPLAGAVVDHARDYLVATTSYLLTDAVEVAGEYDVVSDPPPDGVHLTTDLDAARLQMDASVSPDSGGRPIRHLELDPEGKSPFDEQGAALYRATDAFGRPANLLGGHLAIIGRQCDCAVSEADVRHYLHAGIACCKRSGVYWTACRTYAHAPPIGFGESCLLGRGTDEGPSRAGAIDLRAPARSIAGPVGVLRALAFAGRRSIAVQGSYHRSLQLPGHLCVPLGLEWQGSLAAGDLSLAVMMVDADGAQLGAVYDNLTNSPGASIVDNYAKLVSFSASSQVNNLHPKCTTATGETRVLAGGTFGVQLVDPNEVAGVVLL